jgi:hypothetical protein
MFRSKLIIPALSAVCLFSSQAVVPPPVMASPLRTNLSIQPIFGNKMVKLNLANNTGSPLDVKVGDTPMTIAPGKTVPVSAPAGTKITVVTAFATHGVGTVLAEISPDMSGATIRVN